MKKIQLEQIKAGMRFTSDVFLDEQNLFVPSGVPVKQKDIDQLSKWGITHVLTDGDLLRSDAPAKAQTKGAAEGKTILRLPAVQENKEFYRLYKDMIERLDSVFNQIKANEEPNLKNIDLIVQSILGAVRDHQEEIIGFVLGGDVQGFASAKSSINSAILAAVVGSCMKLPGHKLMQLTLGAVLHDVGMLRVPEAIVQKRGNLSEEESQKIKAHPLYSYRIIAKELNYPEDVGMIGLQHHERWDGEGYPRRYSGGNIDLGARIVSVADAFEAMVSHKPYRNSMIGYAAMKNLLSDNSRRFDPEVLRSFIKSMGIYPIGSIVLLNNAAIARVIDVHPEAPLRPKLRVLIDEYGKQYGGGEGDIIDLLNEKSLFIARAIDPKEFEKGE
jgi:HD-GYP domain-containing protein (c-di-GMP phosphodiesterase class II)